MLHTNTCGVIMERLLSNVTVKVNNADIRKEKRDGREVWIVPSKTLPRDIVMNGIMYPGEQVEQTFNLLEGKPAPYGHPAINGQFVSALHPMALNTAWVGAHNENATYDGNRVSLDKVIDIETAGTTEKGRRVLSAIDKGDPIHTSTAVYLEIEELDSPATNALGQEYTQVARTIIDYDHDAILIGENGAATPDQGVGIFVNSDGEKEEVRVVNGEITEMAEMDLEWAAYNLIETVERAEKAEKREGLMNRVISAVKELVGGNGATGLETNRNEEDDMSIKQEDFDALVKTVEGLKANADQNPSVADQVAEAIQPLTDKVEALETNLSKRDEAEKAEMVETVVNAGLLDEEDAKELNANALRKLAAKAKPKSAFNMFGAPPASGEDDPNRISDELPGGDE